MRASTQPLTLEKAGIDWNAWEAEQTPIIEEWEPWSRDRWSRMAQQALAQNPKVFEYVPDPIILIDGKYLVTQNTVRKQGGLKAPEAVVKVANWLIQRQIERSPRHGFDADAIKWGNERKPKRGEVLKLREPVSVPEPGRMQVEWLYTYIDADGQQEDLRWIENVVNGWERELRDSDIASVTAKKTPVVWAHANDTASAQQRLHQRLVSAWREDSRGWREALRYRLMDRLESEDATISDEEQARAFMKVAGVPLRQYEEAWDSEALDEEVARIQARSARVEEALTRKRREKRVQQPVLLVNGEYILDGESAGGTVNAFQILNWMALRHLKQK